VPWSNALILLASQYSRLI